MVECRAVNPVVIDRSQHTVSRQRISPEALKVLHRLHESGFKAYLAGGGVRDLLLGRTPKDFDIATDAHPNQVKRLFRSCRLIGRRFRLAHVHFHNTYIEVATFRAHLAPDAQPAPEHLFHTRDGVIARDNVFGTAPEDAVRRDFTVNALFYNIADRSIIDYVGGLKDLDARVIRVIGDARERFREDPVRMIRAIRFASALDFTIEETARQAIAELRDTIKLASRDRLYEEMLKLAFCGRVEKVVEELMATGLFDVLFPSVASWLKSPEGADGRAWLTKALLQVDKWKKAGMIPGEPLLWALLFGAYHESLAAGLMKQNWPPPAAMGEAVRQHLMSAANCVRVPKRVVIEVAQIMAAQPAFERTQGARAERFRRRYCFRDALVYLKFASNLTGRNKELVQFWMSHHTPRAAH